MVASRIACSSIEGYYYQFLYTVDYCLKLMSENRSQTILCEGIEDLDVLDKSGKTCIQIKTSIKRISLASRSFKKALLNFFKIYLENQDILFVFYTNSSPGSDIIGGDINPTLKDWEKLQSNNWEGFNESHQVFIRVKKILEDYLQETKPDDDVNLSNLSVNFFKSIRLEFNNPSLKSYEGKVLDKIKLIYTGSSPEYQKNIFSQLVLFVIRKSIEKDVSKRYIKYDEVNSLLSEIREGKKSRLEELFLENPEEDISVSISDFTKKIDLILNGTNCLTNTSLIEMQLPPNENEYNEFPFVKKLVSALIPSKWVFDAKNNFYQAEYALKKLDSMNFDENLKESQLRRIKDTLKSIYSDEYGLAQINSLNSINLLINVKKQIRLEHNTSLSTCLPLDFFHKDGLLHHVSNDSDEIIWEVKKNEP